jgi:membrane protease YdiL (CAAX protease family)
MATAAGSTVAGLEKRLIAPWWHTLLLVLLLLGASAGQANALPEAVKEHGRMPLYITTIIFEWALAGYVWMGVRRRGLTLRDLIAGKWKTVEDGLLDLAIAFGFWIVAGLVLTITQLAVGVIRLDALTQGANTQLLHDRLQSLDFLTPHSLLELAAFAGLACTAGFCEEVIYRGYLQKQFGILTGSAVLAVIAQAALFGASHGYQGVKMMIVLGVYGALFGILTHWRKSLRPGMMAHAGQDFFTGLALYAGKRLLKIP